MNAIRNGDPSTISESAKLLPQVGDRDLFSRRASSFNLKVNQCRSNLCIPSKAAILIIISASFVGCLYYIIMGSAMALMYDPISYNAHSLSVDYSLFYATLAFVMVFYPLSGFVADVCCTRLRTIVISLCCLLLFLVLLCLIEIFYLALKLNNIVAHKPLALIESRSPLSDFMLVVLLISLLCFVIGLAGYQANFIQLGLDQLFEAPHHYLGLFIHYASWSFHLGAIPLAVIPLIWCNHPRYAIQRVLDSVSAIMIVMLIMILLLIVVGWKKRWFFVEVGQENPYKLVCKVINFARKHEYPLRRSAFTYADDCIPSRLDFAKERYGGPFTTEQVENVKTFLRILIVLLSLGPVLMIEVPASNFVLPVISLHTLHQFHRMGEEFCSTSEHVWETMIIGSGTLMTFLSEFILYPVYVFVIFFLLRKKLVRQFTRIKIGAVICFLGIVSLLMVDIVGHSLNSLKSNISNHSQCMFQMYRTKETLDYPSLNMHWSVLIPPNLLLGIGPLIVVTTTYEFISAQSPQFMKGLIIGVFFAIRGLFQFLNSIIILPLSLKHPWASGEMLENPPVTNCGFVYLLFTCIVGLIGLVLFSVAAKKYKYRRRDEGMFCQHDVEEIYDRYLTGSVDDLDR